MLRAQACSISWLQHHVLRWRRLLLVLAAFSIMALVCESAKADLDTRVMYSIEWLVDESDTIAIVREPQNPAEGNPKVLRCIKGNAASIVWPLTPMKTRWESYKNCVPPASGPVRLLFIRGSSQLLQAVSLGRQKSFRAIDWNKLNYDYEPIPIDGIRPTLYGVTQFGDLLLTESSLYDAIDARLKLVRVPIRVRTNPYGGHEFNSADLGMIESVQFASSYTTREFPLACSDEHYTIVVPLDTHRRDYYLEQLKNGSVFAKIFAIHQLAGMMDTAAHAAVRVAVKSDEVGLIFSEEVAKQEIGHWNSVRMAAITALGVIDKHRDLLLDRLASPQATDKIDAIKDLALFNDPLAVEAIRRATQLATATPYINIDKGTRIDVQTVRETAVKALEQIERGRLNELKSR